MTIENIDNLASEIFEQNKAVGWWDDMDRCIYQTLQLVSTEVAEATEGERKNLMDDHIPTRKMGEVKLADALIRLLDLAGRYEWYYNDDMKHHHLINEPGTIGRQHFAVNMALADLGYAILYNNTHLHIERSYSIVVDTVLKVALINNYDVWAAIDDKLEYNKTRQDHTREAMSKKHGKKF